MTLQNKLVSIISQQITKSIVIAIEQCRAWAIIVDTTSDVTSCEQVSICVRIVHINGTVSEHLLAIQNANSTTAENVFDLLFSTLQSKGASFNKLVAQAYDGASNMSGCFNGLQVVDKFQCYLCTLLCPYIESSVVRYCGCCHRHCLGILKCSMCCLANH